MLALGLSACNSPNPTAPTPPPAPPVSPLPPTSAILGISVIGDQWISTTSAPVQMTARVITSNTPFEYVDGTEHVTWSVEPPGIATVDRLGRVTPIASGSGRVLAVYGDKQSFNTFRVLPDYGGTWSGTYRITNCTGHYDFRICGRLMFNIIDGSPGQYPFTLVLSQFRDQATGTLEDRNGAIPVTGLVRESGTLVLEASVAQPALDPLRITNWSSTMSPSNSQLSGAFTKFEPGRIASMSYTVRTEHEFLNASRSQ
jgi:hypothetical protein